MNKVKSIHINNLYKTLDKELILNNINLTLNTNRVYGFVGPNGCGKSTLFKIISCLWKYDSGSILYKNEDIINQKSKITAFIESPNFYDNLTVKENIKIILEMYNIKNLERYNELIDSFSVNEFINKKAKKLSLGMKQKLGIIMTLLKDAEIIILDEPTNSLDFISVQALHEIINNLKKDKIILISSHILEETNTLCDEINFMENGSIKRTLKGKNQHDYFNKNRINENENYK